MGRSDAGSDGRVGGAARRPRRHARSRAAGSGARPVPPPSRPRVPPSTHPRRLPAPALTAHPARSLCTTRNESRARARTKKKTDGERRNSGRAPRAASAHAARWAAPPRFAARAHPRNAFVWGAFRGPNNKTGAHSSPTRPTCAPFALIFASTHPTLISDLYLHHINPRDIRVCRPLSNSAKKVPPERGGGPHFRSPFSFGSAPRRGVASAAPSVRRSILQVCEALLRSQTDRVHGRSGVRPGSVGPQAGCSWPAGHRRPSVVPRSGLRPRFSLGFARFPPRSSFDPLRI